jgi:hypothetical protein
MRAKLTAVLLLALAGIGLLGAAAAFGYWLVGVNSGPTASAVTASLSAPTAAQTTEASATSDTVSWTNPGTQIATGTTTYKVVRSPGNVTVCNQASATSPSPCTDSGLTADQTYSYTVTAVLQGWSSSSATASYTALGVTTSSLTGATVGNAYSLTPQATGGTGTYNSWSHTGTLPPGLSFNTTSGAITGTPTTAGTYSGITLTVTDSAGFSATSGSLSLTVAQANTTTSLSISGTNPTTYGAENGITFNVTVAPTTGTGTPTGTVAVKNGSTTVCTTGSLNVSGQASCSPTATQLSASGTAYSLTAVYTSDGNFVGSTSSAQSLTVNADTATLSVFKVNGSSSATTTYGAETNLTFSATVTSGHGEAITNGDTVFVNRGGAGLCTITLTNGSGTCSPSSGTARQAGSATFAGNFNSSGSDPDFVTTAFANVIVNVNPDSATVSLKVNSGSSATTTYGNENASVANGGLSFSATVTATNGETIPTGDSLTVTQGGTTVCTMTLTAGSGTCVPSSTTVIGANASALTVTGTFNAANGDTNFTTTSSETTSVTVNKDSTTVTISEAPTSVAYGNEATSVFTPTATSHYGEAIPNGDTITVSVNSGASTCTVTVGTNTTCTISNTALPAGGPYTVAATFNGDTNLSTTTGTAGTGLTVTQASATPTITLSAASVTYGNETSGETITATVAPQFSGTPTGTVIVKTGSTTICTVTLSGGTGTCSPTSATLLTASGTAYSVTGAYSGDTNFTGSISTSKSLTINQATTTTTVGSSATTIVTGQSVTYTATVAPQFSGTPTGTVTFKDGGSAITCTSGTQTLNASSPDTATCVVSYAAVGSHTISASYGGDTNFTTSTTTSSVTETVGQASTTTTVTSSANPSQTGQPVTVSASVAAVAPGTGTPTGTVTFTVKTSGGTQVTCSNSGGNTQALSSGTATCVETVTAANTPYSVSVSYAGDSNYLASSGSLSGGQVVGTYAFVVSNPGAQTAGTAFGGFTVQLQFNGTNIGTFGGSSYQGAHTINLSGTAMNASPSGSAAAPTSTSLSFNSSGQATVPAATLTLYDAQTSAVLTVSDPANVISGSSGSFVVVAATASNLAFTGVTFTSQNFFVAPQCTLGCTITLAGNNPSWSASVSVTDAYGNIESNIGTAVALTYTLTGTTGLTTTGATSIPATGLATTGAAFTWSHGTSSYSTSIKVSGGGYTPVTVSISK